MPREKKTLTVAGIKRFPPAPTGKRVEYFDAAIPGFALRVTDKADKSFILMTRLNGRLIRLTVGKAQLEDDGPGLSLASARQQARDWMMACAKGKDPRPKKKAAEKAAKASPPPRPAVFTVSKAVAAYEKFHISRLKLRSQSEARRPLVRILLAQWPDRP
jgi:hypothetical protein